MNASHISAYSSITAQVHNLSQQLADYTSGYIAPSCPTRHTMLHHDINLLTIYTHTPTDHPTAVSIINQQTQKTQPQPCRQISASILSCISIASHRYAVNTSTHLFHTKWIVIYSNIQTQQIYTLMVTLLSVHPLPTVWSTTETRNLVLIIFKVKLVVVSQLKTAHLQQYHSISIMT